MHRARATSGAHEREKQKTWPNFFIVGAAKAGTTSLHKYLASHPKIFMCPMMEPHYFSRAGERIGRQDFTDVISDEASYLKLFEDAAGYPAIGERSNSYLGFEETADSLREQVPDARIIIVLRDPIERAFSHYLMDVRNGIQRLAFHEAVLKELDDPEFRWKPTQHRYTMLYHSGVKRYLEAFGPERVLVALTEDLKRDPPGFTGRVVEFLGLDAAPVADIDFAREHNVYAAPRNGLARAMMGSGGLRFVGKKVIPLPVLRAIRDKVLFRRQERPKLEARTVEALREVCAEDIERLEALLDRSLPELRRSWKTEDA